MPARVYASAAQVAALVAISGTTETTLRRASRDVDDILVGAVYDVDEGGLPTDPGVAEVLAEMVAEQVAWYEETGDTLGSAAGGGSIGRVTLPDASRGGRVSPADVVKAPRAVALAHRELTYRTGY